MQKPQSIGKAGTVEVFLDDDDILLNQDNGESVVLTFEELGAVNGLIARAVKSGDDSQSVG